MAEPVFIKVVGFNDVERHALNTVFRLSEHRQTAYVLWSPQAPQPPRLALVDGQTYQGRLEAESMRDPQVKLVWIGPEAPANAWRSFRRPLSWPVVVQAMDEIFVPPATQDLGVDLDFDLDAEGIFPDEVQRPQGTKRALIASAHREDRLYFRARLALARLTHADEAQTAGEALELARSNAYDVAVIDLGLLGAAGWDTVRELTRGGTPIPHVIVTKERPLLPDRLRARRAGAVACLGKPPHPGKLQLLLQRV